MKRKPIKERKKEREKILKNFKQNFYSIIQEEVYLRFFLSERDDLTVCERAPTRGLAFKDETKNQSALWFR